MEISAILIGKKNINDGGINRELTEILTQFYMNEV